MPASEEGAVQEEAAEMPLTESKELNASGADKTQNARDQAKETSVVDQSSGKKDGECTVPANIRAATLPKEEKALPKPRAPSPHLSAVNLGGLLNTPQSSDQVLSTTSREKEKEAHNRGSLLVNPGFPLALPGDVSKHRPSLGSGTSFDEDTKRVTIPSKSPGEGAHTRY